MLLYILKWGRIRLHPKSPCLISSCLFKNKQTKNQTLEHVDTIQRDDYFNKDNDREWKGREGRGDLWQSQKDVTTENSMMTRDLNESKFLAQITEYCCELSFEKENRKSSFRLII